MCKAGEYKAADGTWKACLPGATSAGGASAVCNCSAAGTGYNKANPYNHVTGCGAPPGWPDRSDPAMCCW